MIESFFIWLLGPRLVIIFLVVIVLMALGVFIYTLHHFDNYNRWPWEKKE